MSAAWSDSTLSDGDRYRSPADGSTDGREAPWNNNHEKPKMANNIGIGGTKGSPSGGEDLSASQKMISATWGSILTSLLGEFIISSQLSGSNPFLRV